MSLVGKRSSMTLLSDSASHYSHRVRLMLAEKGAEVDVIPLDPVDPPEELLELNPYGGLPTLIDRELVLYEPRVIMEYLEERFPHPPLLPVYPAAKGEARLLMYRIERDWSPLVDALAAGGLEPRERQRIAGELRDSLLAVAPIFVEKPFFMSDDFSMVDCCVAPIVWRLPALGVELPHTKQAVPLFEYMERVFLRQSFRLGLTPEERAMRTSV